MSHGVCRLSEESLISNQRVKLIFNPLASRDRYLGYSVALRIHFLPRLAKVSTNFLIPGPVNFMNPCVITRRNRAIQVLPSHQFEICQPPLDRVGRIQGCRRQQAKVQCFKSHLAYGRA
jgi:hypothetical protein